MNRILPLLPILPFLSCGCIAFNVGRPQSVKTFEYRAETVSLGEAPRRALSTAPVVRQEPPAVATDAGRVFVGLEGRVLRTNRWGDVYRNVDLLRQKRMSFGFFPANAEPEPFGVCFKGRRFRYYDYPEFDASPNPRLLDGQGRVNPLALLAPWYMTPYALLITPFFGEWECAGHASCPNDWPTGRTREPISRSDWMRSDLYAGFSGFMSVRIREGTLCGALEHWALFGFHRFVRYSWGEPEDSRVAERTTTSEEEAFARGPFTIELEVPDIGFREKATVAAGAREAAFSLPFSDADRNANAWVRFEAIHSRTAEPADDSARVLLAAARGEEYPVRVRLRQPPPGLAIAKPADAAASGVVTQVVARAAPATPYRMSKSRNADGAPVWRVEILDEAKTGIEIAALVRPKILAELREGHLARHPGDGEGSVHAAAEYETADDGRSLVFTGSAFALRPVVDGWSYDAETRRGAVRLRAPDDVSPDLLRRWARENVANIVRDKNVAILAGREAPDGARFVLRDEALENGILTVEFEAVQ